MLKTLGQYNDITGNWGSNLLHDMRLSIQGWTK